MPINNNFPTKSEPCDLIVAAVLAAQRSIQYDKMKKTAQGHKYTFMPLFLMIHLTRDVLRAHGIAIFQSTMSVDGQDYGTTELIHSSGQWLKSYCPMSVGTNPRNVMQDIGAAFTYTRRYTLQSALNIAPLTDDDARSLDRIDPKSDDDPNDDSWQCKLDDYGLTVADVNRWAETLGYKTKFWDWQDKTKHKFFRQLKDGDIQINDVQTA